MKRTTKIVLLSAALLVTALLIAAARVGWPATTHAAQPASLGTPRSTSSLEAVIDRPGPIQLETVMAADWEVPLSGLLNLDHPRARAAGLQDRAEPIQIYFHALRHPDHGLFIVDTGVEQALRTAPEKAAIRGLVARFMHIDRMRIATDTARWLARQNQTLSGVFLTHLHLDHVSGLPDIPQGTPIYTGPGETTVRAAQHILSAPIIDRALEGHTAIQEFQFEPDPDGRFEGLLDIFGDRSLWAIHVPGHTPGSTAYLARTPDGPILLAGDASHTRWGWQHGVEPGTYSHDRPQSADSLHRLRRLVEEHPNITVRLGHQPAASPDAPVTLSNDPGQTNR